MSIKILHICTGFKLSFQGGITNYVRSLAQSQYEDGNDVTVLGDDDDTKYQFKYKGYNSRLNGFVTAPLVDKNNLKLINDFLNIEKFDIIHIHMMLNIDWDLYEILKPYRYIVSLHDYSFICPRIIMSPKEGEICDKYNKKKCEYCISYWQRFKLCRYISGKLSQLTGKQDNYIKFPQKVAANRYSRFKLLLENANLVLPVSQRVLEIYKSSDINANYKVIHIGNITADSFDYSYKPYEYNRKIRFIFLGRLSYYKGVNLLMRISNDIDHSKFEIHFYGYSGQFANDIEKVNIINHGKYNQKDLPEILKTMDAGFVLPTWEDNGPQVVMEMLNNHIPVFATRMGGIPDFVNSTNGYLFDPYDEVDFAKFMKYINNLKMKDIILLKNNIVRPTITPEEHRLEVINIYKECLKR